MDNFFVNDPFTVSQNGSLYAQSATINDTSYDYIIDVNTNADSWASMNLLFNTRTFIQNSNDINQVNIALEANLDIINRILYTTNSTYLYSTKPEFKELGMSLETSMLHHYKTYFKILTVLDLYNLTVKFIDFLKSANNYVKNPYKESIRLVTDLNKSSEYYLSVVLNRLITQLNYEEIDNMDWPLVSIIKDVFSENLIDNTDPKDFDNIVDVYNINNVLKYSLSSSIHFPPELKEKINKHKIEEKENEYSWNRDYSIKRRKAYELKCLQNYQIVNIIQKRQLQKYL